jgi:hypothetical protein
MNHTEPETTINIEEIMEQIRREILAKTGGAGTLAVPVSSRRFPPDFYDHLYQISLTHHQLEARLHLTPVNVPLVGPLVQWLRRKLHEVVIFYVNQVAMQQVAVNNHFLQALTLMSQALEDQTDTRTDQEGNA